MNSAGVGGYFLSAGGAGCIKSITPISIAIGVSALTATQTAAGVKATNCLLLPCGQESPNSNGYQYNMTIGTFAASGSDTIVTATRFAQDGTNGATWKGMLVEFQNGLIKSQGSSLISLGSSASATATVTSLIPTNALLVCTGYNFDSNTTAGQVLIADLVFTGNPSTTITATRAAGNANNFKIGYSYVEMVTVPN